MWPTISDYKKLADSIIRDPIKRRVLYFKVHMYGYFVTLLTKLFHTLEEWQSKRRRQKLQSSGSLRSHVWRESLICFLCKNIEISVYSELKRTVTKTKFLFVLGNRIFLSRANATKQRQSGRLSKADVPISRAISSQLFHRRWRDHDAPIGKSNQIDFDVKTAYGITSSLWFSTFATPKAETQQ